MAPSDHADFFVWRCEVISGTVLYATDLQAESCFCGGRLGVTHTECDVGLGREPRPLRARCDRGHDLDAHFGTHVLEDL